MPTYTWDFGNGNTYTGFGDPSQVYSGISLYNVKLTASDIYGCKDSVTKVVKIDTPTASFTLSDTLVKCPPAFIDFKFTGSYYDSLTWLYGDGGIDQSGRLQFTKIYNIPNDYFPTLIVKSPGGCIARASKHILVQGPKFFPTLNPKGGCDTLTVFFSGTTVGTILDYKWNFGDGATDTTLLPATSHFYSAPSDYTTRYLASVTVKNDSGCSVTYIIDTVTVVAIKPSFGADKKVACDGSPILFNDLTKTNGTITNYFLGFWRRCHPERNEP